MNSPFKTLLALALSLIFISCAPRQEVDPEQLLIRNYRPLPSQEPLSGYGRYRDYSYNIYPHGVETLSLSPDIDTTYSLAWDTDNDNKLDSVWIMHRGVWRFSSLRKHPILINDSNPAILTNHIGLANTIRKFEEERPKGKSLLFE